MTDASQPTSGSLEARIIRKCPVHPTCSLTCPRRSVENLGEIASFTTTSAEPDSPDLLSRLKRLFLKGVT